MPLSRITNPFLGTSGYRSVTDFTATAGQTSFTVPSYAVGYIDVYRNGVKLAAADFTATSGTTVVLANPATLGDVITAISTYMGTATNLSVTGGTINGQLVVNSATGVNPFITQVNSTEVLRIDSSGNVGIGTTDTTNQRLKIKQSADTGAASFSFKVEANANDTGLFLGYRGVGAASAADTCAILASYTSTGAYKPLTFLTSDVERMRIESNGNINIGGVADAGNTLRYFDVYNTNTGASAGSNIRLITSNVAGSGSAIVDIIKYKGGGFVLSNNESNSAAYTSFNVGGSERMRIDSSGNLLVGSLHTQVWDEIISGYRTTNAVIGGFYSSSSSYTSSVIRAQTETAAGTGWYFFEGRASGGSFQYGIRGNGTVATSDERRKKNIEPARSYLEDICKIPVVKYNWKSDEDSVSKELGWIAQDVQKVFPNMVVTHHDGPNDDQEVLLLKKEVFLPMLMKCIQEQQALITQLQADVAALKDKA
jgi:Chaperone of endosialidase